MAPSVGNGQVPADEAFVALIEAITEAGGPRYAFREIPPLANQDGGMTGANIRTGLLFNPQRVEFIDRGQSTAEEAAEIHLVSGQPKIIPSPGRISPQAPAFAGDSHRHWVPSRKALVGEFRVNDKLIFVIVCHLKSMRAPTRREGDYAKKQRHAQAAIIHHFAASLLACDSNALVVILGDMNDVPGSKTLDILKGKLFSNLLETVPKHQRYTRRFGGRPQALDHVLINHPHGQATNIRIPHINSDSSNRYQTSDHDPVWVAIDW